MERLEDLLEARSDRDRLARDRPPLVQQGEAVAAAGLGTISELFDVGCLREQLGAGPGDVARKRRLTKA